MWFEFLWIRRYVGLAEAISSVMTKVEMAKYFHLQVWKNFAIWGANSIATNLWKCVLRTNQSISYKSIKQFDWICRIQIAKKINIFSHLEMGIFWHFDFCHNRRNGFWSYLWRRPCVPSCFFQTQFEVCDPPRSTLTSGRVVSRLTFCIDQLFHETSIK